MSYTRNEFPGEYIPTVFDSDEVSVMVDEHVYRMTIWDNAGQADYDRIRPLSYPNTDVFLICFSVISPDSYENVLEKWHPELEHHAPDVPILLVGTKTDLQQNKEIIGQLSDKGLEVISREKGNVLARKIGAHKYHECSARTQKGVKAIFDDVIQTTLTFEKKPKKQGRGCRVL